MTTAVHLNMEHIPRADVRFLPSETVMRKFTSFICDGFLPIDGARVRIEELKLASIQEVFLYYVRLHDANFGEAYNKDDFIQHILLHVLPHKPPPLFTHKLRQLLWFEERRPGIVTPFVLQEGRYCSLGTLKALQRCLAGFALEAQDKGLHDFLLTEHFALFLAKYCKLFYKGLDEVSILQHGRFQLPSYPEEAFEALAKSFDYQPKVELFRAHSPLEFLYEINSMVKQEGVTKLLFLGGALFDIKQTPLFGYPPKHFAEAIHKRLLLPRKTFFTENLSHRSITGNAYMIAQSTCGDEDILKTLNALEVKFKRPQTIEIAQFGDGSYLVCRLDFESGNPMLFRLSKKALERVNFSQIRLTRVAVEHYPGYTKARVVADKPDADYRAIMHFKKPRK